MMLTKVVVCLLATSFAFAHDPEVDMSAVEMIRYWGYPAEEVEATTDDGYVLTMHRIPYGRAGPGPDGECKPVIFMQHGLECDSTNWFANLPENSAAFMFADAGFDVWMGNMRGNTYSKNHVSIDPKKEKFWEFSWDEMAQKDLPAMMDVVLQTTGHQDVYYMGHSQGTLTMFSKLSMDQVFAQKIRKFFALAPVGTVKHIKGLLAVLAEWFLPEFDLWVDVFGQGEFLPNSEIMDLLAKWICGTTKLGDALCDDLLFLIAGPESDQFNATRTEVYISHTPAGTSTQNIQHWAQMVKAGTVARYDYGSSKTNQQHYGQSKPPSYDFTKIKNDMYLYWSDDDWLADPDDIKGYLLTSLNPNHIKMNNHLPGYNHLDFIWGMNAAKDIYQPIIDLLTNEMGGTVKCT
ncbi:hypothetical protein PMAYCL1PPCAC_29163 [Pristionchus mayeri]|uniref:Lipase n=1 Tax=Pristionchus mayeri TaxID=1317129 RepID=A0AAN5D8R5_9BILA|nr:hypothetical protein PMAYCL1PPCAC_29163 [Pristionchus mayeri]